ncbi:MAG: DNA alkylation repair protein, partial [Gemmatimonadota bacterium]
MTAEEVIDRLRGLGSESYARILRNHGAQEPVLGVKTEELKKIQKSIRTDHRLALDLFATGIHDAMYLAGLLADDAQMTKKDLDRWVREAGCPALLEYTVAWVAAGSPLGREIALEWIESPNEGIASAGWSTLAGLLALTPGDALDERELRARLEHIRKTIHDQPNRVRYTMNGFLISAGIYVPSVSTYAKEIARAIGPVTLDMGGT